VRALDTYRTKDACQRHCCCALNIVVEGADLCAIPVEQVKGSGVAKVLKLYHHSRETLHQSHQHLLAKCIVLASPDTCLLQPRVEFVIDQRLRVGAHVDREWDAPVRMDSTAGSVQVEFSHRDAHAIDAQVSQPQDPLAIRQHHHVHIIAGPVVNDLLYASPALDRNVHSPRFTEEESILLTSLTDSRCINEGHHFCQIGHQKGVEEPFIPVLQCHEIGVLVEWSSTGIKLLFRPFDFEIDGCHGRR